MSLKNLIKKLRKEKTKKEEVIPPGYVRCTRCGEIVSEADAVISLPEEWWVCDRCYFKGAK